MTFTDEQKQVEFEAFSAYYTLVSKRPITSATRSLLQQLRAIAIGQFGNGAFQELVRANRTETQQKTEVRLGKQSGGGLSRERRNQSPEQQPRSMSPDRAARLAKREAQKSRSEAPAVVAAVNLVEAAKIPITITTMPPMHDGLPIGIALDSETGATERDLTGDARELSAKELVEKHGRDLIFSHLISAGFDRQDLEQKTDRQLANTLKKHVNG